MSEAVPARRISVSAWMAVAFLAGAGTMLLELTAPRLMQPWFGSSSAVWTNVIGVILLALAVGYEIGGRLAERAGDRARRIALLLLLPALWAVLLPFVFPAVAAALLPDPVELSGLAQARWHYRVGSLAAAALLFAPPVFVLATVSPQVIALLHAAGIGAGRAAGRIFMAGTLGSLLGTFLPTYVLIPWIGSRLSMVTAGLLMLVPALLILALRRRRNESLVAGVIVCFGLGVLIAGFDAPIRPALDREEIVSERESAYQYLRVVRAEPQEPHLAGKSELVLRIDEGLREFHSLLVEDHATTGGKYYDALAVLPARSAAEGPLDVAILGSGAGTLGRLLRGLWGERIGRIVEIEIDPAVLELAPLFERRFGQADVALAMDGRAFLRATDARFDLIYVDAYARQTDIPFHMATREFFHELHAALRPGGIAALNVSTRDLDSGLAQGLARSMSAGGFPAVFATPVEHWGNTVLWAARDLAEPPPLGEAPVAIADMRRHALRFTVAIEVSPSAPLFTDVHAPVEHWTDRSLEGRW